MNFKEYTQKSLKEAYGDDDSEKELNLKNTKDQDNMSKEYSTEESDEDSKEDQEEAKDEDSEIEEEVFALQSQCDGVSKALEVLEKMLNEGPEWALNKVSSFIAQFSKFQQNLTRDEKSQDKKVGYDRVKDIKDESEDTDEDDNKSNVKMAVKESLEESMIMKSAIGILDGIAKAKKESTETPSSGFEEALMYL